jgi:hypothetical protein
MLSIVFCFCFVCLERDSVCIIIDIYFMMKLIVQFFFKKSVISLLILKYIYIYMLRMRQLSVYLTLMVETITCFSILFFSEIRKSDESKIKGIYVDERMRTDNQYQIVVNNQETLGQSY